VNAFLKQGMDEKDSLPQAVAKLESLLPKAA